MNTQVITDDLLNEQIRLEEEMRAVTVDRYFKNHEKAAERGEFADTHAGRNVMSAVLDKFVEGIDAWCDDFRTGKAGRRPRAMHMIDQFGDTRKMAYIYVKNVLNLIYMLERGKSGVAKRTSVALMCSQGIHDEFRIQYFMDNRKSLLKAILKDFKKRDVNRARRRQLLQRTFKAQQIDWVAEGWGQAERLNLGLVLTDVFRKTTGLIEEITSRDHKGRTQVSLHITKEFNEALLDKMENSSNMFTLFYPTVIPPKEWQSGELIGGGYYTDNIQPYRLIKGAKPKYISEMENRDMSEILTPLNAIQNTPWRVNKTMLEVLTQVFEAGINVNGLITSDHKDLPEPPVGFKEEGQEDITKDYKKTCFIIHDENRRNISKRLAVIRTIALAGKFSAYDSIYFPHDLDSRGRAYPRPHFLTPQGADYSKALLEFSEGKVIESEDDIMFLAIAGANAWGQDKLPLHERYEWVMDNQDLFLDIAENPMGDLRWTKADEPFMALRFCLEWAGLAEQGVGVFKTTMPVHFDATCSGLQHFSALLRDREGGTHVNLTNSGKREDIYGEVARKATASIEALLNDDEFGSIARIALDIGITRALCKRPVMIVPYAGTFSSCMQYVNDFYREQSEEGLVLPLDLDAMRSTVTPFVAKHIWAAISDTVIAAREAMDWITATAKLACSAQSSTPLQWTTPDGFIIQQAKYKESESRIKTYLDGERTVRSHVYAETNVLDARRNAQSLSPNYIHSMDACHMRKSISLALASDRQLSFAMIHDSFGCHASDMKWFLAECIKPAFVDMYEDGQNLELFKEQMLVNIPEDKREKMRDLPLMGSLELSEVLKSEFFFS